MCAQSCPTHMTPWTIACQAPLSMGFSRQEYWRGLQFALPGDLSDPGTEPGSPALAGGFFTPEPLGKSWFLPETLIRKQLSHVSPLASGVVELPWCFADRSCISPIGVSIVS